MMIPMNTSSTTPLVTSQINEEIHLPPRFSIGMHLAMIVRPPFTIPDPPIPATARPTMKTFDEEATPQMREPSSKKAKKTIKHIWKAQSEFRPDGGEG
jgi:hypothetical protein